MSEDTPPCFLVALPPELLDMVLSCVDSVTTLGNVVTTTRVIHQHFEARKIPVIWQVLKNELGPVLKDARFLDGFPPQDLPETLETVGGPMHPYVGRIQAGARLYRRILVDDGEVHGSDLTMEDITRICRALREFNLLADVYIFVKLRVFGAQHSGESTAAAVPPSKNERQRILRALYRRQINSNGWRSARRPHAVPFWTPMGGERALFMNPAENEGVSMQPGLMGLFHPWEMQQIDHVDCFVKQLASALWHASDSSPNEFYRVSDRAFINMLTNTGYLAEYMRRNEEHADAAVMRLLALQNGEEDESLGFEEMYLRRHLTLRWEYPTSPCLSTPWQAWRLKQYPGLRGERENRTIEFEGDAVDLVPYGWTDAVGGRLMPWFGQALGADSEPLEEQEEGGGEAGLDEEGNDNQEEGDNEEEESESESEEEEEEEDDSTDGEDDDDAEGEEVEEDAPQQQDDPDAASLFDTRDFKADAWRRAGLALWDRERVEAIKTLSNMSDWPTGWAAWPAP